MNYFLSTQHKPSVKQTTNLASFYGSGASSTLANKPYKIATQGGAISNVGTNMDENTLRYKAMKYHYKIQSKLHQMQKEGKDVPPGYDVYLRPF